MNRNEIKESIATFLRYLFLPELKNKSSKINCNRALSFSRNEFYYEFCERIMTSIL